MIELKIIDDKLTYLKVVGEIDPLEMIEIIEQRHEDFQEVLICDFSECDMSKLTSLQLRDIARVAAQYSKNRKTAHISPEDSNYAISRMYESLAGCHDRKPELMVFRDYESALAWARE